MIDWEDAMVGDPVEDLATARLEAFWSFGEEGMARLTHHYRLAAPELDLTDLALWDLISALRPLGRFSAWSSSEADKAMRLARHAAFVNQALAALA